MKILAVGMNYAKHINELHTKEEQNSLLHTEPVLFSKFDSSIIQPGKPFFVPDFAARFDYETEIVVKIAHVGKDISERFAHRYWNELTVGIDFTARELQKELREKGMPWECCKSFDGSAALGKFISKDELGCDVQDIQFHMDLNGERRQTGHTADMIHTIDHIIAYASKFFTLKTGDLIFTGTPDGIGEVKEGDKIDAYIGDRKLLDLKIK